MNSKQGALNSVLLFVALNDWIAKTIFAIKIAKPIRIPIRGSQPKTNDAIRIVSSKLNICLITSLEFPCNSLPPANQATIEAIKPKRITPKVPIIVKVFSLILFSFHPINTTVFLQSLPNKF